MEILIIAWIILSILFALIGRSRKIGFSRAFLFCILLSPLIGLLAILTSEKHSESLMKLKIAHDSGSLTDDEYNKRVRKIIPNEDDKQNMLIGYTAVIIVGLIIYWIFS